MSSDSDYARLATEQANAAASRLDEQSAIAIVRLMAREERRSALAVEKAAAVIARVAEAAAKSIGAGGRLVYLGAGTSGRLATLDAAECPPTFGTRPSQVVAIMAGGPRALRRAVEGAEDRDAALDVDPRDTVVGIAASGVTRFVRSGLERAKKQKATTALVTAAPRAALRAGVDHLIGLDVGPELIAGSTRLKAGTATKMTLNAISTATMVLLGKCYGPYMVDVKATNAKLRARSRRLVAELGAARDPDALLEAAGGSVKVAIAMARLSISAPEARRRLREAGGRLRELIG
jgi:N-acetylmuramic acid 6-phosphate etherase